MGCGRRVAVNAFNPLKDHSGPLMAPESSGGFREQADSREERTSVSTQVTVFFTILLPSKNSQTVILSLVNPVKQLQKQRTSTWIKCCCTDVRSALAVLSRKCDCSTSCEARNSPASKQHKGGAAHTCGRRGPQVPVRGGNQEVSSRYEARRSSTFLLLRRKDFTTARRSCQRITCCCVPEAAEANTTEGLACRYALHRGALTTAQPIGDPQETCRVMAPG